MRARVLALGAALALSVSGCATAANHDNGWTGTGETTFEAAERQCATEAAGQGEVVFEACMASLGWTRTR